MTPTRSPWRAPRGEAELWRLARSHQWDGISAQDVAALLVDDWSGSGPIHLEETLPLAELEAAGAVLLANARALLRAAAAEAPEVRPLAIPEFRLELDPLIEIPGFYAAVRAGLTDPFGTKHVEPQHWMTQLLQVAGLLERVTEGFAPTDEGLDLLAEAQAGRLYAHLFRTFFRRFNLACLDRFPEPAQLQDLVPHWLWVLTGPLGTGFVSADVYGQVVIPRPLSTSLDERAAPARLRHLIQTRVLDPLADLGLLEPKPGDDETQELGDVGFRPTVLFRRFVRVDIPYPEHRVAQPKLRLLR